ncbi:hypothetical protein AciX8_0604 [Granulicella mallensis MP5ACTX8]|uniref:DUF2029 domain-containing protein n=2 Tax=Granulicella mallensis TaxID=940614 RepID=G8NQ98_GRAMM|nr:hypothetical protein AciX8_0604 [Granulicella mallensis MP5ACTX8]
MRVIPKGELLLAPNLRRIEMPVTQLAPMERCRAGWFTALLLMINFVGDGWSGRPIGVAHQLFLLPFTAGFLVLLWRFLCGSERETAWWSTVRALRLVLFFEILAGLLFLYECHHFAPLGYRLHPFAVLAVFIPLLILLTVLMTKPRAQGGLIFGVVLAAYVAGVLLAITSFPLNYLRSDMLPVIQWADTNLLHHLSPYATMYVGDRIYNFPYLPGMLVAFFPFVAAHLDIRFGSIAYVVGSAVLVFWAAKVERRREVAALLGLFLLCPFLQYRHELYLQPHWFTLVAIFVLMQRRHFAWAAFVFGVSMAIYQFSWILFPFFLLNAFRRRGWLESAKLTAVAALGALAVAGPFLESATRRIANNTVGQWGLMPHAEAMPINLSYWVTYLVRPDKLLRLQAVLMIALFLYCVIRKGCETLEDTLRWSILALTVFILFNVLVDGYFYLMLLVPMLLYTCVANGWWREAEGSYDRPDAIATNKSAPGH